MSALKLSSPSKEGLVPAKISQELVVREEVVSPVISLLCPSLSSLQPGLRKRQSSSLGRVVARKWRRLEPHTPLRIILPSHGLASFTFSSPSPDDVVLAAQSQSRAFTRPATAS